MVLVRWDDVFAVLHWAGLSGHESVRTFVSHLAESRVVRALLARLVLSLPLLSDASSCVSLLLDDLAGVTLLLSLLARKSRHLAAGTTATGTWWAEIHHDCGWPFIVHLIAPPLLMLLWLLVIIRGRNLVLSKVFPSAYTSSVSDASVLVTLVAKLKASPVVILLTLVAIAFKLVRWAVVRHWDIALAWNVLPHWRNIVLRGVSIGV